MKILKSFTAVFIVIAMLLTALGMPAAAQQTRIRADVDWYASKVLVTYTSPLSYDAYVAVYVVPASNDTQLNDFTKVVCTEQVLCPANSEAEVEFVYDTAVMDGVYDIYAIPGGKDSAKGYSKLAKAFKIFANEAEADILAKVNGAAADKVGAVVIENLKDAFKLTETECSASKSAIVYQIKLDDFGGAFGSIADINNAWNTADDVYALSSAKDEIELTMLIESTADTLEFDVTNSDYVNYKADFVKEYYKKLFQINSETKAMAAFDEIAAVTAFNKRDTEGKANAINQYIEVLGLEQSKASIDEVTPAAIARQLDGKTFTTTAEIKAEVLTQIAVLEQAQPQTEQGGSRPSGGGSGSASGGSAVVLPKPSTPAAGDGATFGDVPVTHWANTAVEYLADKNVVNGFPDNTFKGENVVTREEFVKMAVAAFAITDGSEPAIAFADVEASFWAAPYIKTAVSAGVIKGISANIFGVSQPVTRQDAAVIIARILGLSAKGESSFTDSAQIADYAADAVGAMSSAGIINGYTDGSFGPEKMLSRSEAAQIIYNALTAR